jgi:hypothetical protein
MARLPRYVLPGQVQHIIQRGNNQQVIFASDAKQWKQWGQTRLNNVAR